MVLFYSPPKKSVSQKAVKLVIHSIDAFGQGIAHYQGKTVFVKNALPTEEVEVKLTEDKKQYAKGRVIKYCITSQARVKPTCQHYTVCGGCEMQHIPSDMQHHVKAEALVNLLKKETGEEIPFVNINIVNSTPYHYRRRARLAIMLENNNLVIGFRKLESKQIIDIKTCPVLVDELEQLLIPLKTCLNKLKDKKALGHIELINVDSGTIFVLRHIRPLSEIDRQRLVEFAKQYHISLYLHGEELVHLTGNRTHYYCVNQLQLTFSPLDFIQVNGEINLIMIEQAKQWLALQPQDSVLDLFCGMGNFSLPMATRCRSVNGVEGVADLVEKAKSNIILNKDYLIGTVDFFVSNLELTDNQEKWYHTDFNKVLLDPARAGAYQIMDKVIAYRPTHIVYISCNPATLARDSKKLLQAGYHIAKASILDMFPQTKHIESMLLFTKLGIK